MNDKLLSESPSQGHLPRQKSHLIKGFAGIWLSGFRRMINALGSLIHLASSVLIFSTEDKQT